MRARHERRHLFVAGLPGVRAQFRAAYRAGVAIEDLPALDAVVLSHMRGDHWDRLARHGLDHALPVITTPKAARTLRRQGFAKASGLPTWADTSLTRDGQTLRITALPGRHATGLARHLLPPVMGSLLEYRPDPEHVAIRLYITGDTLFVDELREIPRRYPELDVAVLHLGGTRLPGGILVTMDARQGADLLQFIRARTAVPIHNDDYGVFKSPLSAFRSEVERRGLTDQVSYVEPGQTIQLPV